WLLPYVHLETVLPYEAIRSGPAFRPGDEKAITFPIATYAVSIVVGEVGHMNSERTGSLNEYTGLSRTSISVRHDDCIISFRYVDQVGRRRTGAPREVVAGNTTRGYGGKPCIAPPGTTDRGFVVVRPHVDANLKKSGFFK